MASQEDAQRLSGRLWMRFSAYELSNEPWPTIRPAAGATVELYDPWEADRSAKRQEDRPHRQLLRLAQQIDPFSRRVSQAPKRQRDALMEWVHDSGLLGILPHEMLEYTTAPHWHETPLEEEYSASRSRGVRQLAPYQLQVRRSAVGWQTTYHRVGDHRPLRTAKRGDLVDDPKLMRSDLLPVETTYRTWPRGEIERKPLGQRFAAFFSGRSLGEIEQIEYLSPSTEPFWRGYGESADGLVRYAAHLAAAIAGALGEWSPPTKEWRDHNALLGINQINDAAYGTTLAGRLDDDGAIRLQWASASLFGCFAVMILEDLSAGQRVMRCPVCHAYFLAVAHQTRFCSTSCRYTYHKRAQRQREAGS